MKNLIITTAILIAGIINSCKKANNDNGNEAQTEAVKYGIEVNDSQKTGSFSIDEKNYSAPVETQYFGDHEKGNFSLLCQHNESDDPENANHQLLQLIFLNEKDAQNATLKIYEGGSSLPMTDPEPGIVAVSLSGVGNGLDKSEFTGSTKSTGTISVKNRIATLKDVVLFNAEGAKKVINAALPF